MRLSSRVFHSTSLLATSAALLGAAALPSVAAAAESTDADSASASAEPVVVTAAAATGLATMQQIAAMHKTAQPARWW